MTSIRTRTEELFAKTNYSDFGDFLVFLQFIKCLIFVSKAIFNQKLEEFLKRNWGGGISSHLRKRLMDMQMLLLP